jgi:hypothetical protein
MQAAFQFWLWVVAVREVFATQREVALEATDI